MKTATIRIFIGAWNDRECVVALDDAEARALVESSSMFGDPLEDEYALGNSWAADGDDQGWRIIERTVTVPVIAVEILGDPEESTAHVAWQCPYCSKGLSDDWLAGNTLPVLLGCGCEDSSKIILGTVPDGRG